MPYNMKDTTYQLTNPIYPEPTQLTWLPVLIALPVVLILLYIIYLNRPRA